MKIECYMSLGCGSEESLRENIKAALSLEGADAGVVFRRIRGEEAYAPGLNGSPSVFINGKDIDLQQLTGFF